MLEIINIGGGNMKTDKIRLVLMTVVFVAVIATSALLGITLWKKGQIVDMIVPGVIAVAIVAIFIPFMKGAYGAVKKGIPFEDERLEKIKTHAAAYTYYVSLYVMLGLAWLSDSGRLNWESRHYLEATILISAILFGLFALYFSRKKDF